MLLESKYIYIYIYNNSFPFKKIHNLTIITPHENAYSHFNFTKPSKSYRLLTFNQAFQFYQFFSVHIYLRNQTENAYKKLIGGKYLFVSTFYQGKLFSNS